VLVAGGKNKVKRTVAVWWSVPICAHKERTHISECDRATVRRKINRLGQEVTLLPLSEIDLEGPLIGTRTLAVKDNIGLTIAVNVNKGR
jgi:hypothetical protein